LKPLLLFFILALFIYTKEYFRVDFGKRDDIFAKKAGVPPMSFAK
jgi:hypothetical protein